MEYRCSVCNQKVGSDMLVYLDHTEKHVLELVKTDHPDWVESSGICQKCVEYYRSELKGSIFKDAACVKRRWVVRSFFGKIKGLFQKK